MRYHGHGVKSDLCGTVTFYLGVSFGLWVDKSWLFFELCFITVKLHQLTYTGFLHYAMKKFIKSWNYLSGLDLNLILNTNISPFQHSQER